MYLTADKVKVSIIIPVHNSEKYLRECVQSAQMQAMGDLEILCIDGGSTDLSAEIISELQKEDQRIKYIKDANTSYGHKLNVGVQMAKGDYVAILESDDKMYCSMMVELYNIAVKFNADIVDADYDAIFFHDGKEYRNTMHKYGTQQIYNKLIDSTDVTNREFPSCGIWTGIYKKEFLIGQRIRLNESKGASFQDTSFLFLTGLLADKVYHLCKPLYQYRVDNNGSSVKDNNKIHEIIGECEFLRRELMERGIQDEETWKMYYTRKYNAFFWNYSRLSSEGREIFLKSYLKELKNDAEAGNINRKMFGEYLYDRTFQVMDNKDKFIKMVLAQDAKSWITMFCILLDKIKNRSLVIFGAGQRGEGLIRLMQYNHISIQAVCDNAECLQGTVKCGISVRSVKSVVSKFGDAVYIIANKNNAMEMKEQLIKMGIDEADIVVYE
ncbi:MAG: glycosyltransferase [Lachnospiraceae bacterium]